MQQQTSRGRRAFWLLIVAMPLTVIAAFALAMAPGGATKTAQVAQATSNGTVQKSFPQAASDATSAYWTKERMAAAKPVNPVRSGKPQSTIAGNSATGAPQMAGGYAPKALVEPDVVQGNQSAIGTTSSGVPAADGGFPGPHTTWQYFAKYRTYPVSTIAKIFFTKQTGGNFVCSGSVTYGGNTNNRNTVWTAGHCVSDGAGRFHTNVQVCPSYDSSQGGVNPNVGCWAGTGLATTTAWHNSGAFTRDYGMIFTAATGTKIANQIVSAVGGLGFAWNYARDQHWMDFGYPSGSPYTGGKIIVSATEHRYDDQPDNAGPATNSVGSAQTPGSSGGPWILGFSNTGGFINSVNSYYYSSGPNGNEYGKQMQGPYHDTTVCTHWKGWTGWSGTC
jgi:hypothetical protein